MKHETIIRHLQKTGLSEKTSIVYSTLLELGGAYPSHIAEVTKLNRSTVYQILTELSIKGLITEIEKGKKLFYQIEKPEKLIRYAKMQSDMAHDAYEKTRELIPELNGLFGQNANRSIIRYFQNAEGIMSIYEEMVSEPESYEMIAFTHGEAFKKFFPEKSLQKFIRGKIDKNIKTRAIAPDTQENRAYGSNVFKGVHKSLWPVIRYVPKEVFPFEAEITLYGKHKIAITKLLGEKLVGIVIEDQIIHDLISMIFELLWKSDQVKK